MLSEKPRHYSPLFRDFRSIDPADKQRIIRRYEEQEKDIGRLDPVEYFELTVLYVDALFATGAHRKHLLMVDLVIYASIEHNIQYFRGEDVYERMLFRKAASAFRMQDYVATAHICQELIRMYPDEKLYLRLYRATSFRREQRILQWGRATMIFCLLLTAFVIVLDLLVVNTFYPDEHQAMVWLRNDLLIFGILGFAGCYGLAYARAHRAGSRYLDMARNRRTEKDVKENHKP